MAPRPPRKQFPSRNSMARADTPLIAPPDAGETNPSEQVATGLDRVGGASEASDAQEAGATGRLQTPQSPPSAASSGQPLGGKYDRRPEGAAPIGRRDQLRPSAIERLLACPGSLNLCRGLPKRAVGIEALDGIRLHEISEKIATHGKGLGQTQAEMKAAANKFGATDEEFWDVLWVYLEFCQLKIVSYGEAGAVPEGKAVTRYASNHQFECRFHNKKLDYAGTCDFVVEFERTDKFPPRVIVADLKTGRGVPVEARGNPQLRSYAALLAGSRKDAGNPYPPDTVFDLWIVQPRSARGRAFSRETLTLEDLRRFWVELVAAVASAETTPDRDIEKILNPGPQCRYCEAAVGCPAARKAIERVIEANDPERISHADPAELAALLEIFDAAEPAVKNIKDNLCLVMGVEDVPGWIVKRTKGWKIYRKDKEAEITALLRKTGKELTGKVSGLFAAPKPLAPGVLRRTHAKAFEALDEAGLLGETRASFSPVRDTPTGGRKPEPPVSRGESVSGFDNNFGLKEGLKQ